MWECEKYAVQFHRHTLGVQQEETKLVLSVDVALYKYVQHNWREGADDYMRWRQYVNDFGRDREEKYKSWMDGCDDMVEHK